MSYYLDFLQQAQSGIVFHKKTGNKAVLKKLYVQLNELNEQPYTETGKPEKLKYILAETWSCRINQEHRLVYEVTEDRIFILSVKGDYQHLFIKDIPD